MAKLGFVYGKLISTVSQALPTLSSLHLYRENGALGLTPGAPSLHSHALTKYATINGLCYSLPLNGARRLGGAVEHHAVDLGDGVGDAGGDAR